MRDGRPAKNTLKTLPGLEPGSMDPRANLYQKCSEGQHLSFVVE
jgi:hypothetical protein